MRFGFYVLDVLYKYNFGFIANIGFYFKGLTFYL